MKHCYHCGHITPGEPFFCNSCGRSYDVKLCSRLHPNPRTAEVCSRCGSRDLSTPQPKISLGWRILAWLTRTVLAVFFILISIIALFAVVTNLLQTPEIQGGLIVLGLLLAALYWLWSQLPGWFRKFVLTNLRKKKDRHEHD